MKISLYLACAREVKPMLEMTPLLKCQPKFSCCRADQKQAKSKNLHIIFFGDDVTICMYPLPLCHFLSLTLGMYPPPPYPGGVIFGWPVISLGVYIFSSNIFWTWFLSNLSILITNLFSCFLTSDIFLNSVHFSRRFGFPMLPQVVCKYQVLPLGNVLSSELPSNFWKIIRRYFSLKIICEGVYL